LNPSLCPRAFRVTAVLALALVGPLGGLAGASPAGAATASASAAASSPRQRPDLAASFTYQINRSRAAAGRPRLAYSSALTSVAAGWAMAMARSNRLAHNPHLATSVRGWHFLGENVGVGYSVSSLEGAFWASSEHRANMLDRDYSRLGVAVVDVSGKLWVVEDFELPMGAKPAPAPSHLQHQATHATASRTAVRTPSRAHVSAPARPRTTPTSPSSHRNPEDPMTEAVAAQAMRVFTVRRTSTPAVKWTLLRQSMINGRHA
jgi:hypothetical protein